MVHLGDLMNLNLRHSKSFLRLAITAPPPLTIAFGVRHQPGVLRRPNCLKVFDDGHR